MFETSLHWSGYVRTYVVTFATRLSLPGPSVSFPKPRMYVRRSVGLGLAGGIGRGWPRTGSFGNHPSVTPSRRSSQVYSRSRQIRRAHVCSRPTVCIRTYVRIPHTCNKRMLDSHQQEPVGYSQELPGTYVPVLFYEMTSVEYHSLVI